MSSQNAHASLPANGQSKLATQAPSQGIPKIKLRMPLASSDAANYARSFQSGTMVGANTMTNPANGTGAQAPGQPLHIQSFTMQADSLQTQTLQPPTQVQSTLAVTNGVRKSARANIGQGGVVQQLQKTSNIVGAALEKQTQGKTASKKRHYELDNAPENLPVNSMAPPQGKRQRKNEGWMIPPPDAPLRAQAPVPQQSLPPGLTPTPSVVAVEHHRPIQFGVSSAAPTQNTAPRVQANTFATSTGRGQDPREDNMTSRNTMNSQKTSQDLNGGSYFLDEAGEGEGEYEGDADADGEEEEIQVDDDEDIIEYSQDPNINMEIQGRTNPNCEAQTWDILNYMGDFSAEEQLVNMQANNTDGFLRVAQTDANVLANHEPLFYPDFDDNNWQSSSGTASDKQGQATGDDDDVLFRGIPPAEDVTSNWPPIFIPNTGDNTNPNEPSNSNSNDNTLEATAEATAGTTKEADSAQPVPQDVLKQHHQKNRANRPPTTQRLAEAAAVQQRVQDCGDGGNHDVEEDGDEDEDEEDEENAPVAGGVMYEA
ncbi:hypothetical protein CVT26_004248 [Gymnopilus dilepis]|uniref:Uncharacterized protein n=1 Tax=Gymnopilus dilepis TaxID=231916 RepID=A0A409W715_9AGAR|nr:hypothetical protein CVT26_004248 [Gymnopilus dilepis]